jgi:uncharacterized protein YlxW (UPF0749 family)
MNSTTSHIEPRSIPSQLVERYDRQHSFQGRDLSADRRREQMDCQARPENGAIVAALKEATEKSAKLAAEVEAMSSKLDATESRLAESQEVALS